MTQHDPAATAQALVRFIRVGVTVLTARLLTLLALISATALFAWALYAGTVLALAGASAYAVLVLLPSMLRETRQE